MRIVGFMIFMSVFALHAASDEDHQLHAKCGCNKQHSVKSLTDKIKGLRSSSPFRSSPRSPMSSPLHSSTDSPRSPSHSPKCTSKRQNASPLTKRIFDTMNLWDDPYKRIGDHQKTMLMYSAGIGDYDHVSRILKYDSSGIDLYDTQRKTALILAARCNYEVIIETLLFFQPRHVYHQDHTGYNALMYAAELGSDEPIDMILSYDASGINDRNQDGKTALMLAAESGSILAVKALLKYKPNICITDNKGFTVTELLKKKEDEIGVYGCCAHIIESLDAYAKKEGKKAVS